MPSCGTIVPAPAAPPTHPHPLHRAENILLTDKKDVTSVVLTDFGISRCGVQACKARVVQVAVEVVVVRV